MQTGRIDLDLTLGEMGIDDREGLLPQETRATIDQVYAGWYEPDEALGPLTVGGFDTDAGVQAKPAPVIPRQHVFGFVGFQ